MATHDSDRVHELEIGHGLELVCAFGGLDGSVDVKILHGDHQLFGHTFTPDDREGGFNVDAGIVRADGAVEVDPFSGELWWAGHLSVRLPTGWKEVFDVDRKVLLRFSPGIGSVGGSDNVVEPVMSDFGGSQLCTPAILRIPVADEDRAVAGVGRIVKQRMFPDHPPFTFNTLACVGKVPDGTPGLYTDPTSIWFNVFFGFYQLDCPKSEWSRPFGYRSADGLTSEIEAQDVVRLGKSDWNWFSNWMYGVPMDSVLPYSSTDMGGIEVVESGPRLIGESMWHGLTLRGVEVASTYESGAEGAKRLTSNTIIDDVWRNAFGLPSPQDAYVESFIPTRLIAQVDMAYWEDDSDYHTTIFGGTAALDAHDADPSFLAAQMKAVRGVIESDYPELGFEPA